jgi:hypothetical protein
MIVKNTNKEEIVKLEKIGIVPDLSEEQLTELEQVLRVVGVFMTKRVLSTVTEVIGLYLQNGTDISISTLRKTAKKNELLYPEQK